MPHLSKVGLAKNLVERCVILSPGWVLQIAVPDRICNSGGMMRKEEGTERERILDALRLCGGRISGAAGAAERLGMKRTSLHGKITPLE